MNILSTLTAVLLIATLSFAGVKNGDSGNGNPHGNVIVTVSGGIMGDYKVTFKDDAGTSSSTTGTPTMGGNAGEVEDTDWVTTSSTDEEGVTTTGGTYRIKNGKLQKKNANGDAVDCGPAVNKKKKSEVRLSEELVGTLP